MRHATAGILAAGLMSWAGSASAIPFAYISNSGDGTLSVIDTSKPATPRIVATGGLASTIAPLAKGIERVDEDLTLEGLRLLWELNA